MTQHLKHIDQQCIVITGASSGIGLATARLAAQRGARVMLASRDGDALSGIVAELRATGADVDFTVTDVSEESEVEALAARTIERFGGFDTWVNNAGVGIISTVEETSTRDHHALFETNYFGLVYGSLAAVRHFRETGKAGALINLGSAVSDLPIAMSVAYSATKHAIKGFTDGLRIELKREGLPISVTLIKPSAIDTRFFDHAPTNAGGIGKGPGPQYAPSVVAEAIVFAAQHHRRDISVGSTSWLGGPLVALLPGAVDAQQERVPISELIDFGHQPEGNVVYNSSGGHERSRYGHGRGFSVSTTAQMHPGLTAVAVIAGIGALAAAINVSRR